MSDLIEDLDALHGERASRQQCSVGVLLDDLPEEQAKKLSDMMDGHKVSAAAIARVLHKHGYLVSDRTIARHRRRGGGAGCTCP